MTNNRKLMYLQLVQRISIVFVLSSVICHLSSVAAEIPEQWLGKYEVSDVEKKNTSRLKIALSDLNLDLTKTRLGFDAQWIKFDGNINNQTLMSQSRSNSYLERDQKNVFFTPSTGKIYAGEEFSWAQLTDKGLVLYAINTDPHGRYILTTYHLTLDKQNLKFHLSIIVENESYGDIKGTLVKREK